MSPVTSPTTNAPDRAEIARRKALRRRHLLQRQTIIFGTIVTLLALSGVLALGVYLRVIPPPFDEGFYDAEAAGVEGDIVPCPAEGALPIAYGDITANVYNGAGTAGLAGGVATALQNTGVLTAYIANYAEGEYDGVVLIEAGRTGVASAYTVATLFPNSTIQFDPSRTDATIDIVLGTGYESMNDPAAIALDPTMPLAGAEGCTPYTQLPDPLATQEPA